jgi:hypothetical protein
LHSRHARWNPATSSRRARPRPLAGSEAALGEQADEVRACGWWVVDFDPAEHLAFGYA